MKLGRDTNSVVNWLMSGTNPAPEVGMGVTVLHWTDRSAGTVTRVSASGKTFWFKPDMAIRTDTNGMSESQSYRYETMHARPETKAVRTKRGWKVAGGNRLSLGHRSAYHDYSF